MEIKGNVQEFKEFMEIFQLKEEKATLEGTSIASEVIKKLNQNAIEHGFKASLHI